MSEGLRLNKQELAWAAGLFDGEGYVGAVKNKYKTKDGNNHEIDRIQCCVLMTDYNSIARFAKVIGSKVRGPYKTRHYPKHKAAWKTGFSSFEFVQFTMCLLWNWLGEVKKEQFKLAIKRWVSVDHKKYYKPHNALIFERS